MGKINTEKIEAWSINSLERLLDKSKYIKYEINSMIRHYLGMEIYIYIIMKS